MAKNLVSMPGKFARDISAATAIEYGLIAGGIAIVIVGGLALVGGQVSALFTIIAAAFAG
jgi:pilus assembly protein Flp/PilA